ncbi:protein asteroid homolog 1 isoform X2 [Denticeps clupeoides]|uniref:Asteroid domain-containing protein n=2 Tax=Denticeps clupeoides TaxID=299321 RepID=A0AAY4BGQ3_9TELE|nr:protein asteroid homolog 1-like isoform X2 [Denticeps clupeoides]XP_028847322.1 protein asteroid homolog 1-like isoform X2 [Denticeps clupeoides]XP_028847324.1 protein asteroid homolog 1-like isoform X2 [Denticeps clupeoides]
MGIHGLTSYVEENRHFLSDVKLRDTQLVIDGCSLYFNLYFTSGLDQQRGGDYDAFAAHVRHFFSALFSCGVRPFVLLDGGMDESDRKFPTLRQRAQRSIKEADALSHGAHGAVLPLLVREVFKQVLSELAVPLYQCVSEADLEVAALAGQWGCPVLTNDSDFFIFDLRGGYLPIRFFHWEGVDAGGDRRYIPARRYAVNRFCSHFSHMSKRLLPLFAVVAGNDYTPARTTQDFFSRAGLAAAPGRRIDALLRWFSRFRGPEEALEEVLELLAGRRGGQKAAGLRSLLTRGMLDYQLPPHSPLSRFFAEGPSTPPERQGLPAALASQPDWLLRGLAAGTLPSLVQDVLVLRRTMMIPQVENGRLPSGHRASLAIRQVFYGLLLQGPRGSPAGRGRGRGPQRETSSSNSAPCAVEEYDRQDLDLRRTSVDIKLPKTAAQLHLKHLDRVPLPGRLQVLLDTLGVEEQALGAVPAWLALPVCVTIFWVRNAKPRATPTQMQALLLGFTYGEMNRRRCLAGDPVSSRPGVASLLGRLDKMRVTVGERRNLDRGLIHTFSQWQSCMWAGLCVNQLLCRPLHEPHCAWLFSGTLLHGVELLLRQGTRPESLLAGDALPAQLYSCLLDAVLRALGEESTPSSSSASSSSRNVHGGRTRPRGRGRGRGRGSRGPRAAATSDLENRFALLMSEEDEDEE